MTQEYAIGTTVKLRSGGPLMTVKQYYESDNQYLCQWFAGKKLEKGNFPFDSLDEVKEEE